MRFLKGLGQFFVSSLFASSVMTLSITVFAEELSKVDSEAMNKTVEMMKSRSQRQQQIGENKDAEKADEMAKSLLGDGAELDSAYAAAAEIFRKLATDSNGDMGDMMHKLQKAQQDPEGFYKTLSPEHKQMIKGLAEKAKARKQQQNPQGN